MVGTGLENRRYFLQRLRCSGDSDVFSMGRFSEEEQHTKSTIGIANQDNSSSFIPSFLYSGAASPPDFSRNGASIAPLAAAAVAGSK